MKRNRNNNGQTEKSTLVPKESDTTESAYPDDDYWRIQDSDLNDLDADEPLGNRKRKIDKNAES